jgi:hypothetical protein
MAVGAGDGIRPWEPLGSVLGSRGDRDGTGEPTARVSEVGTGTGAVVRAELALLGTPIAAGPASAAGLTGAGVAAVVAAAGRAWPEVEGATSLRGRGVGVAAGWLPARVTNASLSTLVGPAAAPAARSTSRSAARASGNGRSSRDDRGCAGGLNRAGKWEGYQESSRVRTTSGRCRIPGSAGPASSRRDCITR